MRATISVLVALALLATVGSQAAGLSVKLNGPAAMAARRRQEAVRTLDIRFKRTEVVTKRNLSDPIPPLPQAEARAAEVVATLESTNRLVLDGVKVRYEDNHPQWNYRTKQTVKRTWLSMFDGSAARLYCPIGRGSDGVASGTIEKSVRALSGLRLPESMPIWFTFRELNPDLSSQWLEKMKPSGSILLIDGARCQEYTITYPKGDEVRIWLAPEQDHVLRRLCWLKDGRVIDQVDVRYRQHEVCGWAPVAWERSCVWPHKTFLTTTRVEVLELRLNEVQPAELFNFPFPAGTLVSDNRDKRYLNYRVQEDGNLVEVDREGREIRYAIAFYAAWYQQYKGLLAGSGAIVAVLTLMWIRHRWRSRRTVRGESESSGLSGGSPIG